MSYAVAFCPASPNCAACMPPPLRKHNRSPVKCVDLVPTRARALSWPPLLMNRLLSVPVLPLQSPRQIPPRQRMGSFRPPTHRAAAAGKTPSEEAERAQGGRRGRRRRVFQPKALRRQKQASAQVHAAPLLPNAFRAQQAQLVSFCVTCRRTFSAVLRAFLPTRNRFYRHCRIDETKIDSIRRNRFYCRREMEPGRYFEAYGPTRAFLPKPKATVVHFQFSFLLYVVSTRQLRNSMGFVSNSSDEIQTLCSTPWIPCC